MGRPSEFTPELRDEALKLAAAGVPKRVIADIIGVGRSTLYRWLDWGEHNYKPTASDSPPADLVPYQEFRDAFVQARGKVIAMLIGTWLKEGFRDASQAAHWLKVNEPELFKDQAHINLDFGKRQSAMDEWKQSIIEMTLPKEIDAPGVDE